MEFSTIETKLSCQHNEYCGFSKSVCIETDFSSHCNMKNTDIEDMNLLNIVKERIGRDKRRERLA